MSQPRQEPPKNSDRFENFNSSQHFTEALSRMNILGGLLVIVTNCCYIANSYAVKWAGLGAGEVSLVRGALQVLVFSAALLISTRAKNHRNNIESQKCKISWKSKCVNWQFKLLKSFFV